MDDKPTRQRRETDRITLQSGERITFIDGSEMSVVVCLDRLASHSVAGSDADALLALADQFKAISIQLEGIADARRAK